MPGPECVAPPRPFPATPFLPFSEPLFSPSCAPTRKSNFLAISSNGGDRYANGLVSLTDGSGIDKSADPSDPSTWVFSGTAYAAELMSWFFKDGGGLPTTGLNGKLAWDSFDLGSSIPLETLYLFNNNYQGGISGVNTYNLYYADSQTVALPAAPNKNTYSFAMLEKDAPPPPPIFSQGFEADGGGFTATGTPNDWAWGTPNSNNNAGLVLTTGNAGSTGAWATNLGLGGAPSGVIDPAADSILRSPAIDLTGVTGAKLSFAAAYDASSGDVIEVLVRNAATDALIATIKPVTATLPASSGWTTLGPFDLSPADNTNIYVEFRYDGTDANYIGLYIDDVEVTQAP